MCPDGDSVLASCFHDDLHGLVVPGMTTAGHMDARDDTDQIEFHLSTDAIDGLAHIRIEINRAD
jgi:hypothetical protein